MILSLLDYFQRALWHKRHKELWKYACFSPIPPRTPIIPQGMYILMIGVISNYIFFFLKWQNTCLHTYQEKHTLKIYLFSVLKSPESSCQETGGGGGRVVPHDFMQRPHATCKPQLDWYVGLYLEPSISSLWDTELQSVPWESHNGATTLPGWPCIWDGWKERSPEDHH